MNIINDQPGRAETMEEFGERCRSDLLHVVFTRHNITESDYGLIYNLTGREAFELLPNYNQSLSCFCGQLRRFQTTYRQVHGYLSFVICIFGVLSNILNIIVLTRREMVALPINRVLRGLAYVDIVLMLEYIPFIFFYYFQVSPHTLHTYWGAVALWVHVNFMQIVHTISVFVTLALAFWRYSAIRYPQRNVTIPSEEKCCNPCVRLAYILPFVFCLPAYLVFSVNERRVSENGGNGTIYVLDFSTLAVENDQLFFYLYFWLYFVIIKLVPCVILTVITCWLIHTLKMASERRDELQYNNLVKNPDEAILCTNLNAVKKKKHKRIDRSTNILIAVLTLFIITELPQGILGLLSVIFGQHFFKTCYMALGDIMDILALFNGAVDFILYCTMSKQFRKTFGQLFKPRILTNLMQTQEIELVTTNV